MLMGSALPTTQRVASVPPLSLLAASWLLLLGAASTAAAAKSDAELLLAFKASFSNGGTVLADWTAGGNPCVGWYGVSCSSGGRVTDL